MTTTMRRLCTALGLLAALTIPRQAKGQALVSVGGVLIDNRSSVPAPGLKVSLIHPAIGRSAPSFSDASGRFGWTAIPVRPEPYFLEVYWGETLIYRKPLLVNAAVYLPNLQLGT